MSARRRCPSCQATRIETTRRMDNGPGHLASCHPVHCPEGRHTHFECLVCGRLWTHLRDAVRSER